MIAVMLVAWAWKSTAVALLAMLAARAARGRAAADRAGILLAGVIAQLALPFLRLGLPLRLTVSMPQDLGPPVVGIAVAPAAAPPPLPAATGLPASGAATSLLDGSSVVGLIYLAGLLVLAARLLLGIRTLRRWTAAAEPVVDPEWRRILDEVAAALGMPPPRLLLSSHVPGPLSSGIFRPVVLIDERSMRRTGDAKAILLHELAHVGRRDWIATILARIMLALFWFNPLVWLLARRLEDEIEAAADQRAARLIGTALYAQTIVDYARRSWFSPVPAVTIASTRRRLSRRVVALLNDNGRAPAGRPARAGVALVAAALVVPLGSLAVAIPVSSAVVLSAAGEGSRPVPARSFFPFLAHYYSFPPAERSKVEIAYRLTIDGKPADNLGLMLDVGGRRTPIRLAADGWVQQLPSAADLAAGAVVVAARAPHRPVKLDIRPNLQTSIVPARDINAADCALALSQVNAGARRTMGLFGFFLGKVKAVTFPGAGSGVAVLGDGRIVPLPELDGSPAYDPQSLPSARVIRLARTPMIVDLETET